MSLAVCSLFSGIGGFELAARRVGFSTNLSCEIDLAAQAVLKKHFPEHRLESDVSKIAAIPAGTDIVAAGFPCQNLSMAGDKSGIAGAKSKVVERLFELLDVRRSPFAVIENVPFMLYLDGGQAMRWLVGRFEKLGYRWAYRTLDSRTFGLPQRRRRIYLVASTQIDPADILFRDWRSVEEQTTVDLQRPIGFYWTEGRSGGGLVQDGVPPIKVGSTIGIKSTPAVLLPDGTVRTVSISACERLQGFPVGWTKAADEIDSRSRWRLVGNAVSVPVASWVLRQLTSRSSQVSLDQRKLVGQHKWPKHAHGFGGHVFEVRTPHETLAVPRPTLDPYHPKAWPRISVRALRGFHGRASAGPLNWPAGFLDAIDREVHALAALESA
jgi:DNA (cytosine-5)-methyltransferase 1